MLYRKKFISMLGLLAITAVTSTNCLASSAEDLEYVKWQERAKKAREQRKLEEQEARRIASEEGMLIDHVASRKLSRDEDKGRDNLHRDFERSLNNLHSHEFFERDELNRRRADREAMNEYDRSELGADERGARERIEHEREDFLKDEKLHRFVSLLKAYAHGRASADDVVSSLKHVLKDAKHVN